MKSTISRGTSPDGSHIAEGYEERRWEDVGGKLHIAIQKVNNHRNYRRRGEGFPVSRLETMMRKMVVVEALLIAYVLGAIFGVAL